MFEIGHAALFIKQVKFFEWIACNFRMPPPDHCLDIVFKQCRGNITQERRAPSHFKKVTDDDIELTAIADAPAELQETVEVVAGLGSGSEHTYRLGRAGDEIMALQVDSGRWGIISQEDFDKLQFDLAEIAEEATEE